MSTLFYVAIISGVMLIFCSNEKKLFEFWLPSCDEPSVHVVVAPVLILYLPNSHAVHNTDQIFEPNAQTEVSLKTLRITIYHNM